MEIETRDLRWAIAISQHRSLRQAAVALNVRQCTLSRRVRDMEIRLGVTLFERGQGGTRSTAVGREFLKTARHLVAEMDATFSWLKEYGKGRVGQLAIGVYMALSAGNLRATLADYHRALPKVEVRMTDGAHADLLTDLANDVIDVAILAGPRPNWGDRTLPLWTERVVAALPETHPLAARSVLQWVDLAEGPLLVNRRIPGPEFHRLLMAELGDAGAGLIVEQDVGIDRLLSLVGAGLGATLVLEGATGASYPGVVYREIRDPSGPERMGFVACWRQANSNPALGPFLNLLRERYPDLTAEPIPST